MSWSRGHTAAAALLLGVILLGVGLCGRADDPKAPRAAAGVDAGTPARRTTLVGRVVDENGAPVPNAQVTLEPGGPAPPARAPGPAAVTDAEGVFALPGELGPDPAARQSRPPPDLVVRAAGYAVTALPLSEAPDPLVITLTDSAGLRGRLSAPRGHPGPEDWSSVTVSLAGSGVWPPRDLPVDAQGRFQADGLPEGIYELSARAGPLVGRTAEPLALEAGDVAEVSLPLTVGRSVRVIVRDALAGTPLTGVDISIVDDAVSGQPLVVRSDAQGRAALAGLWPGRQRISLERVGYVPIIGRPLTLEADVQTFELERGATLIGRVVDARGDPVPAARLEVRGTARDGSHVYLPRGSLAALDTPQPTDPTDRDPGAAGLGMGESLGVTRGPVPRIPLTPMFRDAAPGPSPAGSAPGAPPTALPPGGTGVPVNTDEIRTNNLGFFEIQAVPAGNITIFASNDALAPGRSEPLEVEPGEQRREIEITLADPGVLWVRVLDGTGAPASGVPLELAQAGVVVPRGGVTDASGAFRFERVAGPCTVTARPHGHRPTSAEVSVEPDASPAELTLHVTAAHHSLSGRVFEPSGQPLESARVAIAPLRPRKGRAGDGARGLRPTPGVAPITVLSGRGGEFDAVGLPPPPYLVRVAHVDYASLRLDVQDADAPLSLTLPVGHLLTGEVLNDADRPVADGVLRLRGPELDRRARIAGGAFAFHNVAAGRYTLVVDDRRFALSRTEVVIDADARVDNQQTLRLTRLGTASGTVVDRLGAPVAGATVSASRSATGRDPTRARTDAKGEFTLAGLAPGESLLVASHPSAGRAEAAEAIRVEPGKTSPGAVIRLPGVARGGGEAQPQAAAPQDGAAPPAGDDGNAAQRAGGQAAEPATEAKEPDSERDRMFTSPALSLERGPGGVRVARAAGGAARAGIQPGDRLVQVDGEHVFSAGQARSMLRGRSGSTLRLRLRRGGKAYQVRLRRP